ncbi:MAG: CARDB domain-containing protein [Nitrospiria bacterium]
MNQENKTFCRLLTLFFLAFLFVLSGRSTVTLAANFGDCSSGTSGCYEDKTVIACSLCHDVTITRANGTARKLTIAQSAPLSPLAGVFPGPRVEGSPSDPSGATSWWATINHMVDKGCPIGGNHTKLGGGSNTSVEAVNAANYLGVNYCPTCTGVILSSVDLINITTTSATITWNTSLTGYQDGLANSVVFWGTGPSTMTNQISDSTATGTHSITITGLNPSTKYYFSYQSTGANGVTVKWPDALSFKTAVASGGGGGGGTTTTTFAYVVNQGSNSISVVNTSTKAVQTTIFLTEQPYGIASSPDGKTVYVSTWYINGTTDPNLPYNVNDLVVIDTATSSIKTVVGNISPNNSAAPMGLAVSPDGKYLFGVNSGQLLAYSTTTLTLIKTTILPSANTSDLSVTPDGKTIYIVSGSYFSDTEMVDMASAVNPSGSTIVTTVTMPKSNIGASAVVAGPDGRGWIPGNIGGGGGGFTMVQPTGITSLVPSEYSGPGVTINTLGDTVYSTTKDYRLNGGMASIGVAQLDTATLASQFMFPDPLGNYSYGGIAVSPDGSTLYVSATCGGTPPCSDLLYFIDTATFSVAASVPVGSTPNKIALVSVVTGTPAGPPPTLIYSANGATNNVSVIDPATNTITATVSVGTNPLAIAPTPDGKLVYVVNGDGTVSVITRSTQTVTATINLPDPVTGQVAGLAGPTGTNLVYVANHNAMKIYVINTQTNSITATIPVGSPAVYSPQGPLDMAITPDGQTLYVNVDVNPNDPTNADGYIAVIRTSNNTQAGRIILPVAGFGTYHSGGSHIAMNPLGGFAYVSADPYAVILDTTANRVVTSIKVPTNSKCYVMAIGVTPDGSTLAVSCWNILYLYDTSLLVPILNSGQNVAGIISSFAITGDSAKGYLAGNNTPTITNVDMTTLGVITGIPAPSAPNMVAASPAVQSVPGGTPVVLSAPDLTITAISATSPVNLSTSSNMTITDTVKNQGGSNAGSFVINYYLSPANYYDPATAILIGSQTVGSLSAGASSSLSTTITIPTSVAVKDYYVLGFADVTQQIAETNENNNISSTAGTSHLVIVDLVETSVTSPAIGTGLLPGSSFTVTDTVMNQGSASAGPFTVGIFLYPTGAGSVVFLGGRSVSSGLAPGNSSTGSITAKVPSNVSGGTYYLQAVADYNNQILEANKTNDTYTNTSGVITIPQADLLMTSVSTTATSVIRGGTVSLSYTVKNQSIGGASAFRIGFYLSTDSNITTTDKLLSSAYFKNGLGPGVSFSGTVTLTIPTTVTPGNYYLGAYADYTNAVVESDETNNGLATSGTIQVQ